MHKSLLLVSLASITFWSWPSNAQQTQCVRDSVGNVHCPQQHQPVDLSRTGLEGIDSYYQNQESQARAEALRAQTRALEAQRRALEAQQNQDSQTRQSLGPYYRPTVTCTIESQTTMLCPNQHGELVRYRREE
jgi:hypothetical protein